MLLLRVRTLPETPDTIVLAGMPAAAAIGDDTTIPRVLDTLSVVAVRTSQPVRVKDENAGTSAGSDPVNVLPSNEQFCIVPPLDDRFDEVEIAESPAAIILQPSISQFACVPDEGLVMTIAAASLFTGPSKPVIVMSLSCQPVVATFMIWTVAGRSDPVK